MVKEDLFGALWELIPFVLLLIVIILGIYIFVEETRSNTFCEERGFDDGRNQVFTNYECRNIDDDGRVDDWVIYKKNYGG